MRLTDSQLLEIWEQGYARMPSEQAFVLLAANEPNAQPEDLLSLSVGQRDLKLLRLRQQLFGNETVLVSHCSGCSEQIEISISIDELVLKQSTGNQPLCTVRDSWRVGFRVPSAGDLVAIQRLAPDARRAALLNRCISKIEHEEKKCSVNASDLPANVVKSVVDAMADADPQANIEFQLKCNECGHGWTSGFDIVSFLWREINDWAQKLLLQIHSLAKAYGWTQDEVLKLSRWRRQVYLGMARQ